MRRDLADHLKPGDSLGVDVELPTNRLLAVAVANWLETPRDAIALNVMMSVLPDCTTCAERTNLEAKAKGWVSRSRIPVTGGSRPEPPEYLSIGRNHAAS